MKKILFVVCTLFFFAGCSNVTTPAIEGNVIDKATKQPVENAWVLAMAEIVTYNPGGAYGNYYRLTKLHSWTGKDGKFSIPSISTSGLGAELIRLRIDIYAPEGKRGTIDIDTAKGRIPYPIVQDNETIIKSSTSLKEKNLTIIIPVKKMEMTIEQTKKDVEELSMYCGDGTYMHGGPKVNNACDAVEYDYLIKGYESLLKMMNDPKAERDVVAISTTMFSLASRYEESGRYEKALDCYQKLYEFDKKNGMKRGLDQYRSKINELRSK